MNRESPTPNIDAAWCNAAHWYHEALAEDLETIAVAKLVVCIEVLLRTEKTSGSTNNVKKTIETMFGLSGDYHLPHAGITVNDLVASIVRIRSRILHGTWFALQPDLPPEDSNLPRFETAEALARGLLADTAILASEYASSGAAIDDIKSFLLWIETKHHRQTS